MNLDLDELRQEIRTASGSLYYCQNQLEQIQRESEEHRKRLSEELEQLRDQLKESNREHWDAVEKGLASCVKMGGLYALWIIIMIKYIL